MTSVSSVAAKNKIKDASSKGQTDQCVLIQKEIWRVVSEAAESGASLALGRQAQGIESALPNAGCTRQGIEDALVFAAVDAGVAVAIGPTARADVPVIELGSLFKVVRRGRHKKRSGTKRPPDDAEALRQATG